MKTVSAVSTNQDLLDEAEPFLRASLGDELYDIVAPNLTRQFMKKLYMPIVYGKLLLSSITDVEQSLEYSRRCYESSYRSI